MLYVACTRAKEQLFVLYTRPKLSQDKKKGILLTGMFWKAKEANLLDTSLV